MGTRSRILLRRSSKVPVYLWMHWDGYFGGQGNQICKQLCSLLSKYSKADLQSMLDAMECPELTEDDESQNFSAEELKDFIEGHTTYKSDPWDDVDYQYTIDFSKGLLLAESCAYGKVFVVTFKSIKEGFLLSELEDYLEH